MDPDDVGEMVLLWQAIDEEGLPHPDSPFAKHFTKAKIMDGFWRSCGHTLIKSGTRLDKRMKRSL
jgi:hypothetical protein